MLLKRRRGNIDISALLIYLSYFSSQITKIKQKTSILISKLDTSSKNSQANIKKTPKERKKKIFLMKYLSDYRTQNLKLIISFL